MVIGITQSFHKGLENYKLFVDSSLLEYLKEHGGSIKQAIKEGKYKPNPVRRVEIPKREVDSLALTNAQLNLQTAYNNFFRDKKVGFPKFKSKKYGKLSYTTNNQKGSITIMDGKVKLPKVGYVKVKQHRQIAENQKIKSATISKNPSGKYHISILIEYEYEPPVVELNQNKALGLDYSSSNFYVDSQGVEANWIHKLSVRLSDMWDYICVEDMNLCGLAGSLHLGKSTNDNGFGMFRALIDYKLLERGKRLLKIDKWFPSIKTCNLCGCLNDRLTLADREWICDM